MEPRFIPTSPRNNPRRQSEPGMLRRDRFSLYLIVATTFVVAAATSLGVLFLDPFKTLVPSGSVSIAPELVRAFRESRERLSPSALDELDQAVVNLYDRPSEIGSGTIRPLGVFRGMAVALSNDGWFVTAGAAQEGSIVAVGADRRVVNVDRTVFDRAANLTFLRVPGATPSPLAFAESASLRPGDDLVVVERGFGDLNLAVERVTLVSPRRIDGPFVRSSETFEERLTLSPERQRSAGALVVTPDLAVVGIVEAGEATAIVPARSFSKGVAEVVELGVVARPFLGVRYVDLSSAIDPDGLDVSARSGALLVNDGSAPAVAPGSPADVAGLRVGDRITHVNGEPVNRSHSLTELVSDLSVNAEIRVRFVRNGELTEVTLSLTPQPSEL